MPTKTEQPRRSRPELVGKAGRPTVIKADQTTLKEMTSLGNISCTTREVASFFGCSEDTLHTFWKKHPEFKEAYQVGMDRFRVSLRRNQFELSKTNAAMAIFLGKNYLAQTDKLTHEHGFNFEGLTDDEIQIVMKGMARQAAAQYAVKSESGNASASTVQ